MTKKNARDPGASPPAIGRTHCAHPALERCLEQMNTHIENPLSLAELSRRDLTGMPGDLEPPRTLVEKGAAATKDF